MRAWKLTLFLLFVFAVTACAPKPAEQPEAAPVPDTSSTAAAPSEPAPVPAPVPAPAPAPVAKPVAKSKPTAPAASTATAATAAPSKNANETPLAASRDKDVAPAPKKPEPIVIASGTELNIILSDSLSSGKAKEGDTFTASLAAPVYVNGVEVLKRGAKVEGKVVSAEGSGRVSGKAHMAITLTGIDHGGKIVAISTQDLAAEAESTTGRDAKVIGGGAGVGAIIGAIAGGKKGAAIGAGVGGAAGTGGVLATKGKEVEYPSESKLTFIVDRDFRVTS
jgi:hypothetical protein